MKSALFGLPCLCLAAIAPAPLFAQPATAPTEEMAAEQCIGFKREGNTAFRLINNCEQQLSVAVCADTPQSTTCARDIGWQNLTVAPKTELPTSYAPLQVISLFACRTPAVVQMRPGGMGNCDPTGLANLPLLLASSLKNASSIITSADYPRNVRAAGTTRFDMVVNAQGQPQNCIVTVSAGDEALDKATCNAFMKRARFTPAKDATGKPATGRYRGTVTWKEP